MDANILARCQYIGKDNDGRGEEQRNLRLHKGLVIPAIVGDHEFHFGQWTLVSFALLHFSFVGIIVDLAFESQFCFRFRRGTQGMTRDMFKYLD